MKVSLPQIETPDASLRPFGKARSGATSNKADLAIEIHPNRAKMGAASAARASLILRAAIAENAGL